VAHTHEVVLGHVVDPLAIDEDLAGIRFQQAEDQPQDRALPRAARAEKDLGVPRPQREADVPQDDLVVKRQVNLIEDDDRPAGAERFIEERRTGDGQRAGHQYINTMRSCVTK
jgi:hypothetical protein